MTPLAVGCGVWGVGAQLYMTQLESKESVLVAGAQAPVLSLALQASEWSLWVGTTSSTISAWPAREGGGTKEALQASTFLAGLLSLTRVRSSAHASTAPVSPPLHAPVPPCPHGG